MKKELFAFLVIITLLIGSISSLTHLNDLISQINTHIEYSLLYCSLDDYEAAHTEMEKALQLWNNSENYTHVFIRHSEVDTASDGFYDALSAIYDREKYEAEYQLKKLQYHTDSILRMEQISLRSIF